MKKRNLDAVSMLLARSLWRKSLGIGCIFILFLLSITYGHAELNYHQLQAGGFSTD